MKRLIPKIAKFSTSESMTRLGRVRDYTCRIVWVDWELLYNFFKEHNTIRLRTVSFKTKFKKPTAFTIQTMLKKEKGFKVSLGVKIYPFPYQDGF